MNRDTCGTCFAPSDLCQCSVLVALTEAHKELDEALRISSTLDYERIGRILGTYGGRWVFIPDNRAAAPPDGTAVYVRRRVKE